MKRESEHDKRHLAIMWGSIFLLETLGLATPRIYASSHILPLEMATISFAQKTTPHGVQKPYVSDLPSVPLCQKAKL